MPGLGKRIGYGRENMLPQNLVLSVIRASLLWVGWFGFNAGSAWAIAKKPSVLGMISGAVAGLVPITPASGFVDPVGALIISVTAGVVFYVAAVWKKKALRYDDSMDAWGVHDVGGALGAVLTGAFASSAINPAGKGWLNDGNIGQMLIQLYDVGITFAYCAVGTFIILKLIDMIIGMRVSPEVGVDGLDINLRGETVHD